MNTTTEAAVPLGRTVITLRAKQALRPHEVLSALWRHAREPWGKCFNPDDERDGISSREDRRLVSNHLDSCGRVFRIATETETNLTTVCLAGEKDLSCAGLVEDWVCNIGCPSCGE